MTMGSRGCGIGGSWRAACANQNITTPPTLLSSSTVLRFSIQMASTGPSSTIHVFWFLFFAARRHSTAKMPSVQSPVAASMRPNICVCVSVCIVCVCAWVRAQPHANRDHGTGAPPPSPPPIGSLHPIIHPPIPTCGAVMPLGFMRQMTCLVPSSVSAPARHSSIADLPPLRTGKKKKKKHAR